MVLRRAPSKVVFRVLIPHLETKISVRLFVRVRRPRSTQSPMGAKERAHAGAVRVQPPPGVRLEWEEMGGGHTALPRVRVRRVRPVVVSPYFGQ